MMNRWKINRFCTFFNYSVNVINVLMLWSEQHCNGDVSCIGESSRNDFIFLWNIVCRNWNYENIRDTGDMDLLYRYAFNFEVEIRYSMLTTKWDSQETWPIGPTCPRSHLPESIHIIYQNLSHFKMKAFTRIIVLYYCRNTF